MSAIVLGRIDWSASRTQEGHREYKLKTLVQSLYNDGPATVLNAIGLPTVGSYWSFGNDLDPWAFCWPTATVQRYKALGGEKSRYWTVEQTFSTKPLFRCQDFSIEDPLLEPPEISGGFVKYLKALQKDRHGKAILSSSHEPITGLERDANRPIVEIGLNTLNLPLALISSMVDTLNDSPMWGLEERCIKFSEFSWQRRLYGLCTFYYNVRMTFEIKFETFDLSDVMDTGFKHLNPDLTSPDKTNPKHFVKIKDTRGENDPIRLPLDGEGNILEDLTNPVYLDPIEIYDESNLLLLGIPTSL